MFRFAVKVGLASAAVYYLNEEGIWRESEEALKVYTKLADHLQPYAEEVKKQIPIELPEIPNSERFSYVAANYWNLGVTATCKFLSELPHKTSELAQSGIDNLRDNPEIKKLFESQPPTATPQQVPAQPVKK